MEWIHAGCKLESEWERFWTSSYRNFNDPPNFCKSINKEKSRHKDSDGYRFNVYAYYI